ncbi:hypothetical protein [Actinomadura sp. WMMB 499]|uniref:hypothetical protein n=1 Tax=Actinomadura sp. WMMB 499 TaxID=1219491 RepID=UPI001247D84C|nr:hypothetical protein [Actinomadura sp. WMMB 499]QFG22757.1 hypothetical protein F7P10_18175 [Actinomadura sp. WMMB 499]
MSLPGPARRPFTVGCVTFGVLLVIVAIGLANAPSAAALVFGAGGTGRLESCGTSGETRTCTVAWTAGDRTGSERMRMRAGDEPGDTVPVRVLGGTVVDARMDVAGIFTIALMSVFVLGTAALLAGVPLVLARRARGRSRARRRMDGSGDRVLRVDGTRILNPDGAPFATVHVTHPGPTRPPSSCRIAVASPEGRTICTVDFAVADHRRPETVVYAADGRTLAVVRRRLMSRSDVEVLGAGGAPLAVIESADRLEPGRDATGPGGERTGTVLALPSGAVAVGFPPDLPEPQRAGLLGFALTRDRLYPAPRLAQADDAWRAAQSSR